MSRRASPFLRRFRPGWIAVALAPILAPAIASAQLIVGVDDATEGIWNVNPATNAVQTFLPGFAGTNLATDEVNRVLYFMTNTVQLWKWYYSTVGNAPMFIANLTSATRSPFISMNGIGFDSTTGKLFGSRSLQSGSDPEGFYEINPATGFAANRIATPAATYDWGGIDRDASTGKFYANGDPGVSGTSTPGIFEVDFGTNTFTQIAPYPPGATDMDGLAAGNGKIYMVEDRAVQTGGKIHVYNTITGSYEAPLQVPWFFNETFSGGTYSPTLAAALANVPEPATTGALALAATALIARRKRRKLRRASTLAASVLTVGGACAMPAAAQIVMATGSLNQGMYVGDLSTLRPTNQYPLPANIIDWSQVFVGRSIRGMAADEPNRTLYWLDLTVEGTQVSSTLYKMSYDTFVPQRVGIVRNSTSGFEMGFAGLALDPAGQKMYATYNIGGTPGEGIYEIDYLNPSGSAVFASPRLLYNTLPGGESAYDLSSLDFDPVTNKIYGVNNDSDQLGRGLYRFDLTAGTATKIVSSPDYRRIESDIDGLATGDGKAFFTTDEPGFVYMYDIVANNGQWVDFLSPVLTDNGLFGGAAYAPGMVVPEPGTVSLFAAASTMLALRRRRQSSNSSSRLNLTSKKGAEMPAVNSRTVRKTCVLAGAVTAACLSVSSARAQSIITLVKSGESIAGVGNVTGVDGYAVNNNGEWMVDADTDNTDTNVDRVLLKTGSIFWRENDSFAGGNISSWDDLSLNNNGEYFGNVFMRNLTTSTDSAISLEKNLTLQESAISSAPQFSANTPYIGWFGAKINDSRVGVLMSSVDDPNITSTVDRALVQVSVSPAGALLSEIVIVKEGDVLPGSALAVADLETDSNEFDLAQNGHAIFGADLTGSTLDSGVYRWNGASVSKIALEGDASPAAGRTWSNLASSKVSISGNGAHTSYTGVLSGDTATDNVIVVDNLIYRQEGDNVPGMPGFQFTTFGTVGGQVDDNGNVLWYGDWNDPDTTKDTGIFLNDVLLVQEGVTQINGLTVLTVRAFADTLVMSDNGQYILFEAVLTGNLEGAFLIAVPEPASATALIAVGLATTLRRRRR